MCQETKTINNAIMLTCIHCLLLFSVLFILFVVANVFILEIVMSHISVAAVLQFDGRQFVKVTLPEESHTQAEEISLRFCTMHPTGLLFTTTSIISTDELRLYIQDGTVYLKANIGHTDKVNFPKNCCI